MSKPLTRAEGGAMYERWRQARADYSFTHHSPETALFLTEDVAILFKALDAKDEALEPFAGLWRKTIAEMGTVARTTVTFDIGPRTKLCWGDLRRAAEALGGE